jgi:hypothetical protein
MDTPSAHATLQCEKVMAAFPNLKYFLLPPPLKCSYNETFYTYTRIGDPPLPPKKVKANIDCYKTPGTLMIVSNTTGESRNKNIFKFPFNAITGTFSRYDIGLIMTALSIGPNSLYNMKTLGFKTTKGKLIPKDMWADTSLISFMPDSKKKRAHPSQIVHSLETFKPIIYRILKTGYPSS